MRSGFSTDKIPYIIVVLVFLLQGCGHKGPLTLPAPKVAVSPAQAADPQTTDSPATQQIPHPSNIKAP